MPKPAKKRLQESVGELAPGIWILGFVSLFMDVSTEMIQSVLPLFLVRELGASPLALGLLEGLAEATALTLKVVSGALSDFLGRRKGLAVVGYGLSAASKPLFALSSSLGMFFCARLIDRVGKGVRGAPRDALLAGLTGPESRGAAFGLRQALDTVGAFLGPLIAIVLLWLWPENFRTVLWWSALPAFLSVSLLYFGIQEPHAAAGPAHGILWRTPWRNFSTSYWWVILLAALFGLARFSEAFLLLRAEQSGIPSTFVPMALVLMNIFYAASAYPFGKLADRFNNQKLLATGLLLLIGADLSLALAKSQSGVWVGVALWGLHMGLTQGLLAKMVADAAKPERLGTAYGLFNLLNGVSLLVASALAGLFWTRWGHTSTFLGGAGFSLLALLVLALSYRRFQRLQPGKEQDSPLASG